MYTLIILLSIIFAAYSIFKIRNNPKDENYYVEFIANLLVVFFAFIGLGIFSLILAYCLFKGKIVPFYEKLRGSK